MGWRGSKSGELTFGGVPGSEEGAARNELPVNSGPLITGGDMDDHWAG